MLRCHLLIFNFLLFFFVADAANDNFPIGARAIGLGNAVAANEDAWSTFNNIAGIARLDKVNVGAFFERRYSFSSFDQFAAVGSLPLAITPLKYGNVGVGMYRLGNDLYNEHRFNVGFAHNIMGVNLGIQAEYVQVAISEWSSKGNVVINFGGQVQIVKNLRFGAHIYNINQAKIATYKDERIPTIMKAGLSYIPFNRLQLNVELEKDVEKLARFKAGLEYGLYDKVFFRTGININPIKYFFGLGFVTKSVGLHYAVSVHEQLGLSHSLSISYIFHSRNSEHAKTPKE